MFVHISPYTYLQALLDSTPTSTSLRVEDRDPEDLVPHPVTVAVIPTYISLVSVGRHTGLMWGLAEKSTAFFIQFEHCEVAKADRRPREKKKFYHQFSIVKYSFLPTETFRKYVEMHVTRSILTLKFPGYYRH